MKYTIDKLRQMISDAVRGSSAPGDVGSPWVQEMMPDSNTTGTAIINDGQKTVQRSYTIVDGKVTLGDPIDVVQTFAPVSEASRTALLMEVGRVLSSKNEKLLIDAVTAIQAALAGLKAEADPEADPQAAPGVPAVPAAPAQSSGKLPRLVAKMFESMHPRSEEEIETDVIPLVEGAIRRDGRVTVKIISPGWGSSGYYSESLIKRDGPKAFPKGTHMHWDHPTLSEDRERPERSLNTIAAVVDSEPRYDAEGPAGPGLYAEAKVRKAYHEPLDELAPHIGTSIRTGGVVRVGEAEGKKGKIVEKILPGGTVDFVTTPGRGGEVLSLFEAARGRAFSAPSDDEEDEGIIQEAHQEEDVSQEELEEARRLLAETTRERDEARAAAARDRDALILREASDFVATELSGTKLPDFVRSRLAESLTANPPVKDGALDKESFKATIGEAVKAERIYLAKATGRDGTIRDMGGSDDADGVLSEAGFGVTDENAEQSMVEGFMALGLSESAAKIAAKGRAN